MKEVEVIESVKISFPGTIFGFQYVSSNDEVYDITGGGVSECLINDEPYYCGSTRRFTKDSFERAVAKLMAAGKTK